MLNKKMLLSLLIIGVVSVSAGAGTWAYFTDEEVTSGNTFTAGTVDLSLDAETITIELGADNMKPGDSKTLTIPLSNLGTLDFDYEAVVTTDSATATSLFAVQGVAPENTPATATITSGEIGTLTALTGTGEVVVTVTLPTTAGNDYQGDTGLVTVTITATQQGII
ncbi:MAG: SipW-dependent-type signal peptide-containing protein [Thermoplasmata archaeon]|nr:SipW-dependent-type signal peptide-containing protein [Thermoplasmata archaeon]